MMKQEPVFKLNSPFKDPFRDKLFRMMQGSMEKFLYLDQIERIYSASAAVTEEGGDFIGNVLKTVQVSYAVSDDDLKRIPDDGNVVVVANHPFGAIEGIVLLDLLRKRRRDSKVMANYLLGRMPEMDPYCIYVDPFGGKTSASANMGSMRRALQWLKEGHLLANFPSGEVSHLDLQKRQVRDPEWSHTIARIIRKTESPVIPIFFDGRNGNLFQLMGLIHPRFRTAMLPHELVHMKNSVLGVRVGRLISFDKLRSFDDNGDMMEYLRFRTYLLSNRGTDRRERSRRFMIPRRATMQEISDPVPPSLICEEIDCLLQNGDGMLENDEFSVLLAKAEDIPHTLQEIGRLREITFREESEGTGQATDLDKYDTYYRHLILWSKNNREVVGAYRLAMTDEVLERFGKKGLYTSTLFRYKRALLEHLGPALELGRSFIRPEYQRNYTSLLLLWKGIGAVILKYPRYKSLFGPVSINNDYHSVSRQLLVAFLKINNFEPDLAHLIRARNPLPPMSIREWDPKTFFNRESVDVSELSDLISEIEKDQKGIPVLLKQYLKLGGKLLSFNIDPDFSNVLDGMMWVDLLETDRKIIERFMGKDNAAQFLEYHGVK